ncbi:MAG: hypothetical protein WC261_11490 [Synergistaceae bacterium]|jgi:hypothetical protein
MIDYSTKKIEQELWTDLAQAIKSGNPYDKQASKFTDCLAVGAYMYGAARQIYAALTDNGKFHKLTSADQDKIKIISEDEKIKIEMPVQPDIESFMTQTFPKKLMGEAYLRTASGRYVEGYLTQLKTDILFKPLPLLEVYSYDFIELMKESRHLSIFKTEDIYWFYGNYAIVGEMEELIPGSSIKITTQANWGTTPHHDVIDLLKLHGSPVKRNQPRELIVMPEEEYMDFGKVAHYEISNIAEGFMKTGFSPDESPFWQIRKMFLRDSRGMVYSPHVEAETLFYIEDETYTALRKEIESLKLFGYNISMPITGLDPATRAELASVLLSRYGVVYDCETGSPDADYQSRSKFKRVIVYSPINHLGRVFLWNRDVRNHIKVENDVVSVFSDERLAMMFHNKFAVTVLDIWE